MDTMKFIAMFMLAGFVIGTTMTVAIRVILENPTIKRISNRYAKAFRVWLEITKFTLLALLLYNTVNLIRVAETCLYFLYQIMARVGVA